MAACTGEKKPLPKSAPVAVSISRAERGERSREIILQAAVTLFAERGFHGVSLDNVTVVAGTKRALLLYHFKNKFELWREAAKVAAAKFDAKVLANLSRKEKTGDATRHSVTAWLDAFVAEPAFARMMVLEGGQHGERLDWLIQNFSQSTVPFASPELRRLLGTTVLRDALMAIFLSMSALGPLMEASLAKVSGSKSCGVFPLSSERRAELIDLIVSVVAAFETKAARGNASSHGRPVDRHSGRSAVPGAKRPRP
jgi:AcrR family transcriptional regulator